MAAKRVYAITYKLTHHITHDTNFRHRRSSLVGKEHDTPTFVVASGLYNLLHALLAGGAFGYIGPGLRSSSGKQRGRRGQRSSPPPLHSSADRNDN